MAQLDDIVGAVMKYLKDNGLDDNTIIAFITDNGTENFTWPDGGQTPFAGGKGTALEGGFRVPAIIRWPGKVPAGKVENGIVSGLDWFPTFVAAAGNPQHRRGTQEGQAARRPHLQGPSRRLQPDGPASPARARRSATRSSTSPRARSARCASTTTSTASPISPTAGWAPRSRSIGRSWSISVSIRSSARACSTARIGSLAYYNWFVYEFWRFVFVQQEVAKAAQSFIEFPPMQKGASFNMEAVKEQIQKAILAHHGK